MDLKYECAVDGGTADMAFSIKKQGYIEVDGVKTTVFPVGEKLARAKPVFEYLKGFKADISKCRKAEDLPDAALKYIRFIESAAGCPVKYVSVGAGRDDYLLMR